MNILFTYKGRTIFFLLLICQFGLKLTASASGRMVCDTDTVATKKGKRQTINNDTTLVLKAGSTILRNADTILIINGVPTRLSKKTPGLKLDAGINMDGGAKADSVAKGFQVAPPSKITTIVQPTSGTIQVKNTPNEQPTNTTIMAPPSDGIIQIRNFGNPNGAPTTVPVSNGKIIPPTSNPAGNNTTNPANNKSNSTPDNAASTPGSAGAKSDTTTKSPAQPADGQIQVKNDDSGSAADKANSDQAGKAGNATRTKSDTVLKRDTTTIIKKDTTTILKRDTTTIIKRDTVFKRDTTTIIKRDTTTILKKDTTSAMQQDTLDASEVQARNIYLGVGGAGLAISATYDSRFGQERNGFGYSVGVGGFVSGGNSVITVPFQVNYLIGEHNSMLEVGGGTTFLNSKGDNKGKTWEFDKITGFVATGSIGYRYQPDHKGLTFRVVFVPILYDEGIIPAGGISVGYTFK